MVFAKLIHWEDENVTRTISKHEIDHFRRFAFGHCIKDPILYFSIVESS
jgi:hypothetical protein